MSARTRTTVGSLVALSIAALLSRDAANAQAAAKKQDSGGLPTQKFRDEHQQVKVHLGHVAEWVGNLQTAPADQKKQLAQKVVAFFEKDIKPHAEWEEANLYPVIDQLTGATKERFTSSMRYEHKIIGRWIDELAAEAKKPQPDYVAFSRRADNLLGLIHAHFEEEEQVLLPYADKKMTRAEFEKAVKLGAAHRH